MYTISSQAKLKGLLKLKELLKKLKDLLKLKELKLKELTTPMSSPHPHNSKADEADKAITSKICHTP